MNKNEVCIPCADYHRCEVHWGKNCKRLGGKKIPRQKSIPVKRWEKEQQVIPLIVPEEEKKPTFVQKILTKVVNW